MLKPRLLLKDHRELVFEEGPARRVLNKLRPSDILDGGDQGALGTRPENDDNAVDTGIDFYYLDRDDQQVAVEFKLVRNEYPKNIIENELRHLQFVAEHHQRHTFDRGELWVFEVPNSTMSVWSHHKRPLRYGLANVVSMDRTGTSLENGRRVIDSNYVEERLADWKAHVDNLFVILNQWSEEAGFETSCDAETVMDEEMMQRFAVKAIKLPILKIKRKKSAVATALPIGLWVIGANGRIDILTRNLSFNIINTNKNPKEASWYIVSGNKKPLPFTKEQFFSMIGSHEGA